MLLLPLSRLVGRTRLVAVGSLWHPLVRSSTFCCESCYSVASLSCSRSSICACSACKSATESVSCNRSPPSSSASSPFSPSFPSSRSSLQLSVFSRACSSLNQRSAALSFKKRTYSSTATLLDGRSVARVIESEVRQRITGMRASLGQVPGLRIFQVGEEADSTAYIAAKCRAAHRVGMNCEVIRFPLGTHSSVLLEAINKENSNPDVHGIIVQLPLPDEYCVATTALTVLPEKDVDGFHPLNMAALASADYTYRLCRSRTSLYPCTPLGIMELARRYDLSWSGKKVALLGRSDIVGRPLAYLLLKEMVTLTVCCIESDLRAELKHADVIISACGVPNLITADLVKPGAVVFDVGFNVIKDPSRREGFRIAGDVDFEGVKKVASAITPVPGGVGPMTVAMVLQNTLDAFRRAVSVTEERPK